jgi:AraC family transcriptional regulator
MDVAAATYQGATPSPRPARNAALEAAWSRATDPPLEALQLRHLRAALRATMSAVEAELTSGRLRQPLAAEWLVNLFAAQLVGHVLSVQRHRHREPLPQAKLHAVLEYIEDHLDASPTLEQIARVASLSPTYFASQFRRTTGLPPHRYIIGRRVERAKHLLQTDCDLSLADVALRAGFSDQSQFSHHFKRFIGITPGQFRRRSIG